MELAPTSRDFLAAPLGRYVVGQRHCVFMHSPTFLGFTCWGRPDVEDVRQLLTRCEVGLRDDLPPYRWLVDLRGLELIEPATFGQFVEFTRKHRDVHRRKILKQAQLRPEGLVGAIISGFAHVARLSYPDRVFGDVGEAIHWLELEPKLGFETLAWLERLRAEARGTHPVVAQLRRQLDGAGDLTVAEAARRLGLSTRSLQRALGEAGTTYRMELSAFRIRRAQELLRGPRGLGWIAAELGFSSGAHFATAFKRAVGETPSAWRERNQQA